MSLLSYERLRVLVEDGVITHTPVERINSTSIDITLGDKILVEHIIGGKVSLRDRQKLRMYEYFLSGKVGYYDLRPGQFILAHSQQKFFLPNHISAEYKLKSSMARIGLEHMNAGWCDAGWHGSVLTLELKNMSQHHTIRLHEGDSIGQMVFFEHEPVPHEHSYAARGRYNNDKTVTEIKE